MEIEIGWSSRQAMITLVLVSVLVGLVGFGIVGYFVTPVEIGTPVLLSPDRWRATALARQAAAETRQLQIDATALYGLLEDPSREPVTAMLLAQRIYAHHREGISATATARNALIDAAALVAQHTAGSATYDETIAAVNRALARIDALSLGTAEDDDKSDTGLWLDPNAAL
jgi:hypothetical protein